MRQCVSRLAYIIADVKKRARDRGRKKAIEGEKYRGDGKKSREREKIERRGI